MPDQIRLTPGELLDANGVLKQAGYATGLVRRYDRSAIKGGALRIKEWDYYCISDGNIVLALTIADNSYMSLDSVSLLNLSENYQHTWSAMGVMTLGKYNFPTTSEKGDVCVEKDAYALRFENDGKKRVLTVRVDKFANNKPLTARIVLTDAPEDSMVIATPFPAKKTAFYYNQKINCLRAEGDITFNGRTHVFDKATATAVLDWGRGVWTYKNTWYWGSGNGIVDGRRIGWNLGYGFGDVSKGTENMVFIDGIAHKLGDVTFHIPQKDGKDDFMSPWQVDDTEGRIKLTFTPVMDRASNTDFVVLGSDQHQVFGYFDGYFVLDNGEKLPIRHFLAFAEKVMNKW